MASGDTLLEFVPTSNEAPAANYATLDTRNSRPCLDFDAAANESAVFSAIMPRAYAGGGITVYLTWAMSTAVSGDVDLDIAFERVGDGLLDIDGDSFAAAQSVDNTVVPGTSGLTKIVSIVFTHAQAASIAVGEYFRVKVTRDAVSDTAAGDLEQIGRASCRERV